MKKIKILLNGTENKKGFISLHTYDVPCNIEPDFAFGGPSFNFSELMEDLSQFIETEGIAKENTVYLIRSDDFFQKLIPCETIAMFETLHKFLKPNGSIEITVPNFINIVKRITDPTNYELINKQEVQLFSQSDESGVYFNKTIWTAPRLKRCLEKAGYSRFINNPKCRSQYKISVIGFKLEHSE